MLTVLSINLNYHLFSNSCFFYFLFHLKYKILTDSSSTRPCAGSQDTSWNPVILSITIIKKHKTKAELYDNRLTFPHFLKQYWKDGIKMSVLHSNWKEEKRVCWTERKLSLSSSATFSKPTLWTLSCIYAWTLLSVTAPMCSLKYTVTAPFTLQIRIKTDHEDDVKWKYSCKAFQILIKLRWN